MPRVLSIHPSIYIDSDSLRWTVTNDGNVWLWVQPIRSSFTHNMCTIYVVNKTRPMQSRWLLYNIGSNPVNLIVHKDEEIRVTFKYPSEEDYICIQEVGTWIQNWVWRNPNKVAP